jgi:hypothetical protein
VSASFSLSLPRFIPGVAHRPLRHSQRLCDLFVAPTPLFPPPGACAPLFSPPGFLWCSQPFLHRLNALRRSLFHARSIIPRNQQALTRECHAWRWESPAENRVRSLGTRTHTRLGARSASADAKAHDTQKVSDHRERQRVPGDAYPKEQAQNQCADQDYGLQRAGFSQKWM